MAGPNVSIVQRFYSIQSLVLLVLDYIVLLLVSLVPLVPLLPLDYSVLLFQTFFNS